jgi:hypothetical protein
MMVDKTIQAIIGGKQAAKERKEEEQKNGQKYTYKRIASDDSNSTHIEDQAEESDPELDLEIQRDTFQRKHSNLEAHLRSFRKNNGGRVITMAFGVIGVLLFLYWAVMSVLLRLLSPLLDFISRPLPVLSDRSHQNFPPYNY